MVLGGLQKLTLLDFPGRVACTVFTRGCNFRCPFCHNAPLVRHNPAPPLAEDEFFAFLEKRRGLLDGVAVTGGEPLLQDDIGAFLARIKAMGYPVKLDTNGAYPEKLRALLDAGLCDYVAMDVKNSPEKYDSTAGCDGAWAQAQKSIALLLNGTVEYEFRTTAVKELHTQEDFREMSRCLSGAARYYIQQFRDSGELLQPGLTAPTEEEMKQYLQAAREYLPHAQLRGL